MLLVGQGPPTAGGIPTFVTHLVADRELRAGFELDYLNTTPQGDKRPGRLTAGNLRQVVSDAGAVFARASGADIVHLHLAPAPTVPLVRALVLATAGRLRGSRVILHAHSGRLPASLRGPLYRVVFRALCGVVAAVVVVSREAEHVAQRVCSKVIRIGNGIGIEEHALSAPGGPPALSFVGTVCERKGLLDLRDALVQLRSRRPDLVHEVWIIGDARQEGPGVFERVRRAYEEAGLTAVEFLGRLDRAEVLERLRRSAIFCLPSHWEGFPLSLLEAMAAETAVVATAVGDVPEMLADGAAGMLIAPGEAGQLATALESLLSDPGRRGELARAGRQRAEQCYTWRATVRAIAELYRRIAVHSR